MHCTHLPFLAPCKFFELGIARANEVELFLRTAEVLRLRAASAVSREQSVRRSAQDDESVGV
jgi:hypothetical protein